MTDLLFSPFGIVAAFFGGGICGAWLTDVLASWWGRRHEPYGRMSNEWDTWQGGRWKP